MTTARAKLSFPLYAQILAGLVIGALIGFLWPNFGKALQPIGTAFIKAIKMIVIPLVFCAISLGISKMSKDIKQLGMLGGLAFLWFYTATGIAIVIGITLNHLFHPAHGVALAFTGSIPSNLASHIDWTKFFLDIIPDNIIMAAANQKLIPVLFFAICFGLCIGLVGKKGEFVIAAMDEVRKLCALPEAEVANFAKEIGAPLEVCYAVRKEGRLPVVNFAAGGIATPADAAMQGDESRPLLDELTRRREEAFRALGEGSGQSRDTDRYDGEYCHLLLVDEEKHCLAGAYRACLVRPEDRRRFDKKHLYTASLFDYDPEFFLQCGNALELGRAFVCPEYQRDYTPLLLLWKGIGQLALRNGVRTLFGPASIGLNYRPQSVDLLWRHLRLRHWDAPMRTGSSMATLGVQRQSTMAIFTLREVSVMMQKRVISEAVPAVVLTATYGGKGLEDLSTPS